MSVIYQFDFPCGCHTDGFDPREWHLCRQHSTGQEAIFEWAQAGAALHRAIYELPPVVRLREMVNASRTSREGFEGLPEGTLPRV